MKPETVLSRYLSSPPLYKVGERSKVRLTEEVQTVIDTLLEENGKKMQQGLQKQILKKIDILQLLHGRYLTPGKYSDQFVFIFHWNSI